jgi:hypothetical protein
VSASLICEELLHPSEKSCAALPMPHCSMCMLPMRTLYTIQSFDEGCRSLVGLVFVSVFAHSFSKGSLSKWVAWWLTHNRETNQPIPKVHEFSSPAKTEGSASMMSLTSRKAIRKVLQSPGGARSAERSTAHT